MAIPPKVSNRDFGFFDYSLLQKTSYDDENNINKYYPNLDFQI